MITLFLSQESREPDRDAVGPHELGAVRGLLARQRALRLGLLGPHRQGLGDGHQAVRPHILRALRPGTSKGANQNIQAGLHTTYG